MRVKGERCRDCDPGFFGDFSVVDQAIFSNDRKKLSHFGHDAFFSDTKCPKAMSLQKKQPNLIHVSARQSLNNHDTILGRTVS